MKTFIWPFLILSLAVNTALALMLGLAASRARSTPGAVRQAWPSAAGNQSGTLPAIDASVWPGLHTDELPTLVARLREAGFPPEIIRAILQGQLQRDFAARLKALDPDAENRPYWKRDTPNPKIQSAQRQLYREQEKLLRDLLGREGESTDPMQRFYQDRRFGQLPLEKADAVRELVRDFDQLRSDVYSNLVGGTYLAADQEKIAAIDKQQRNALAKVLNAQQLEEYDFRSSHVGSQLRFNLTAFDASEQEFRTLYQVQKSFEDRLGPMYGPPSPDEMRKRTEAQKEFNEQIKAALGPARYEEYERATNHDYRTTSQLVARLELPPDTTVKVWNVRKELVDRATALRSDQSLGAEQRMQQLAALAAQATERLTPLLGGARGMEAYKQYGGNWLSSLAPRPEPTRPAPKS